MKRVGLYVICFAVVFSLIIPNMSIVSAVSDNIQTTGNLVINAGFEDQSGKVKTADWSAWNNVWQPSTISYSGNKSAAYSNNNPNEYKYLTQEFSIRSGYQYQFSCWIKTENINKGGQATIFIEWFDKYNQYISGCYTNGVGGTSEWKQISQTTDALPDTACFLKVILIVTESSTGKAWFDDINVNEYSKPFVGQIQLPNYKDQITGGSNSEPIIINGQIGQSYLKKQLTLSAQISSKDSNKEYVNKNIENPQYSAVDIKLPTADLPSGNYSVNFTVSDNQTKSKLADISASFVKVDSAKETAVSFRPDGIALVNSEPFFPIGVYEGSNPGSDASLSRLQEIASGGFNCFLNYGQNGDLKSLNNYMDYADELGMKSIFPLNCFIDNSIPQLAGWRNQEDIISGLVTMFKEHPAMLSYYVSDEAPTSMHDQLQKAYQQITAQDNNHPCYAVSNQIKQLEAYLDTTDIIGVDPYPIPKSPINMVSDWTDYAVKTQRPVWVVPQIFDHSTYNENLASAQPTLNQIRCMTYLALTHGATGLIYYSYFDLKRSPNFDENWKNVTTVVSEVKSIFPWLLSTERGELKQINGLDTRYFQNGNEGLLIVVNPGDTSVSAQIPLEVSAEKVTNFSSGNNCSVKNNSIQDELKPLEVKLYKVTLSM